jgi:hypothetical protein
VGQAALTAASDLQGRLLISLRISRKFSIDAECHVSARDTHRQPSAGTEAVSRQPHDGSPVHLMSNLDSALLPDSGRPLSVLESGLIDSVHTGA